MGSGVIAQPFLTSAVGGDEWSASRSGRYTLGENDCGTHCIGRWVALRPGLAGGPALLNSSSVRYSGHVFTELLNSNWISRLYWLQRIRYGTVAWQWLFRVYLLSLLWVLSKRCLAMDDCSASDIPAFRQHAAVCWIFQNCFEVMNLLL
jgi:hypothetical protein